MSFEAVAILPRTGIGPVRFGQSRSQIHALLGEASELNTTAVPGRETWTYEHLDLDVSFDDDAEWLVTSLCVQHPRFTLRGTALVGLPLQAVLELSPTLRLGRCERSEESPFGPILEFPAYDVTIVFRDGIADFITWCAAIDERDEYAWPTLQVAV